MIRLVLFFLAILCGPAFAGAPIPSGALVANGSQIQTATGQNVRLSCADYTIGTPATDLPLIRSAGFNCVKVGWFDKTLSLTALDSVVAAATPNSMRVIFVHLGNEASAACGSAQKNGVWYDKNDAAAPNNTTNGTDGCGNAGTILYSTFKANWVSIATRYAGNETVAGFILHHEPVVAGVGLTTPVNWGGGGGAGLSPRLRVLQYLQGISGTHTLIGQTSFPDEREFNGYAPATGVSPAIMFNDPWLFECGEGCFDTSWTNAQIAQWNAGALVGISALFPNPVTGGNDRTSGVDPVQVINPATAQGARYKGYLDQIANNVCLPYKALGIGMIFRFGFEFDLGVFWWDTLFLGSTGYQNWYRYTHDYLVNTRGCDNMLFVYAANGGPESNSLITSAYPGDAYVDIVGVDAYTNNFAGVYGPIYDILRALAPSKLIALTETGTGDANGPNVNYNLNQFKTDVQSRMPRLVYANWWSGWQAYQYVNANAALNDPFWVNKATVSLPPAGGGGGGAAAGNGSDALAMCNDVGGALTAADSTALIICEGPVNSGTLFGGQANTTVVGDLTLAQTKPVVGTTSGGATRNPLNTFPFTSASVWNVGIGSNATWSVNGDADAVTLHSLSGVMSSTDFAQPVYFGEQANPLVTVTGDNCFGHPGCGQGVATSMHVPANAVPTIGSDHSISLFDSTQPTVAFTGSNDCVLTQSPLVAGAQINCGIGNIWNPLGDGVVDQADYNNGVPNGVNDFGAIPGIITTYDLNLGAINHMVRLAISTNALAQPASNQACVGIPWPNFCVDGGFIQYTGNMVAGLTYGIPSSVNITTLGLSPGGLILARALQTYGAVWRDSCGTSQLCFYTDQGGNGNALVAQMLTDLPTIIARMQILRNQSGAGSGGRGVAGAFNGGGTYPTPAATACAQVGATFVQSNCPSGSGSPIPANKVAYAVDEFPQNVGGRNPDSSSSWITLSNTAYGYLIKNNVAPVLVADMGASLDGTNGALADDQGWASTIRAYLNGTATNGPVFGTCQQPMGMSWRLWQSTPAGNPNGILDPAGNLKAGQQAIWSTLQFTPSCTGGGGQTTTWNPNDKNASITLSNNNKTATTSTAVAQSVRTTTSKSGGKFCWDVQMQTSTTDWTAGVANGSFMLAAGGGLGSEANGAGYYPISPSGAFYYSGVPLVNYAGAADVSGAPITFCFDFTAQLAWVSTPSMVANGTPWNGLAIGSANPATSTGGASVSGLTCPCYGVANNLEGGGVFILNTSASLNVAIPSGFSAWDTGVTSVNHPILINLGANDDLPAHVNDNIAVALNMESAQ